MVISLADVLISLDDKGEKMLRELAKELYAGKKGSLSEVVTTAISMFYLSAGHGHKKATFNRLVKTMEKGYHLGYKGKNVYKKRAELYESRFKGFD